ncbi:MAG: DUF2341 domain-containing protein [Planctomycetota bacterium]|jgi:hypothetical protein
MADWYDPAWTNRVLITIDNTKVAGDETDFPVLISQDNMVADFWTVAKSDGTDVVITSDDGETKLKREVGYINTGSQILEVYVKVPSLSSSSPTVLYLYYGNALASETNDTDAWNGNYLRVWHMNNEVGGKIPESTVNAKHLDIWGAPTQGIDSFPGQAISYDGIDDGTTNNSGVKQATVAVYGKMVGGVTNSCGGSCRASGAGTRYQRWLFITSGGIGYYRNRGNGATSQTAGDITYVADDLYSLVGVEVGATDRRIYNDGSYASTNTDSKTEGTPDHTLVGGRVVEDLNFNFYQGIVSEARLMNIALSANWISTEHQNMRETADFYSIEVEAAEAAGDDTDGYWWMFATRE